LPKKFKKISPKKISKQKFDALIDALPSADPIQKDKPSQLIEETLSEMESVPVAEELPVSKAESLGALARTEYENEKDTGSDHRIRGQAFSKLENEEYGEIFVYRKNDVIFGIPVAYVSEITNEYSTISPLKNFIRSCIGTTDYRGKLLPIFDSFDCHLKSHGAVEPEKQYDNAVGAGAIIAIQFNGINYALTMDTHIGIVRFQNEGDFSVTDENNADSGFLLDIIMYNGENLFVFSPKKIAHLVSSEFKTQISINSEGSAEHSKLSEQNIKRTEIAHLVIGLRDSKIAIELSSVVEIVEGAEVTPLYKVSDFILGLINLRGQVLGCVDLSKFLNQDPTIIDERNKFVVLTSGGVDFAICVDQTYGINEIPTINFQETSRVFSEISQKFFPNFHKENDSVTFVFRPDVFVLSEEVMPYSRN
jgi:purine-binding chemotaxis protein CheW